MSLTSYRPRPRNAFQFSTRHPAYDDAECTCPQTVFIETCDYAPHVDISEDAENLYILAELPGLTERDVHVSVADDILTIQGEKRREQEHSTRAHHRVERSFGEFVRQFALLPIYDQTAITTQFFNGILQVIVPKKQEFILSPTH
jgi:HSP20 family molecular chaperone IbpA